MATGKELARTMECGIWNDFVKTNPNFCWAQIYNKEGQPISKEEAKGRVFCHMRIVFRGCEDDYYKLLGAFLRVIASTRSEFMHLDIHSSYAFTEIMIS